MSMCQEAILIDESGETRIENLGDLLKIMPDIVRYGIDNKDIGIGPQCCLCPVDIMATAKANGFDAERIRDEFAFRIRKKPAPAEMGAA